MARRSSAMRGSRNPFIHFYLKVARKMPGKPVTAIARVAGRRWRAMNMTQRLAFYHRCGSSMEWGSNLPASRRWCTSGLEGEPPVASRSPFINFFVHMYREVGKDVPVTVVARAAAKKWRCLAVVERRRYYEAACRFGGRGSRRSRSRRR